MVGSTIKTYAMNRSQIIDWTQFTTENEWAIKELSNEKGKSCPEYCVAIYYVVDTDKQEIVRKLYATTWDVKYKAAFKELNTKWVSGLFKMEPNDVAQLENPEENILSKQGQIIFLLDQDHQVVGTVAMMVHHGDCELGKMSVADAHQGKGYAHPLMKEGIRWARRQGYPDITLYSSTTLVKAINLYKKHGFITTHLGKCPEYERSDIVMKLSL